MHKLKIENVIEISMWRRKKKKKWNNVNGKIERKKVKPENERKREGERETT